MFRPWAVWYGNGVTEDFVNLVNEEADKLEPEAGQIGHMVEGNYDDGVRRSEIRWFSGPYYRYFTDTLWEIAVTANKQAFGVDISDIPYIQHTTYNGNVSGYYDWHHDTFWTAQEPYDRKLSIVVQLSDGNDYEGGDLELEGGVNDYDHEAFRQKGSVIVFPSFYYHRVLPVTGGVRRSLVAWVDGPPWR